MNLEVNSIHNRKSEVEDQMRPKDHDNSELRDFLPHEQHRQDEVKKVFARAATLEPAESSPKHVHLKLPDHDDLAARP
ncbi:hypothetical protein RJT34_16087 [Clitoria ternatea]|uniref:Uncharacterized protein n=1 Tax=Clitoria ternatea TaxID=43366 RepID=A0AAN9PDD2_CLITE